MKDYNRISADTTPPAATFRQVWPVFLAVRRLRHLTRHVARALVEDWRTHKYALFAALLVVLTSAVVVAYYLNHPQPEAFSDTRSYLDVVQRIQMRGQLVDAWRLPGYPLLIVLVYALAGQGNLLAVSVAQAVLFVLATLELYVLAVLVLRQAWAAFLISLLVGTNLTLLSYVKPIMSEALALWLLVSLALVVTLFVYTLHARALWLVTGFSLALFLTRAEWIYLPLPLFAYLLLVAALQGVARRLLPHLLVSVVLLCALLGDYIYINAMQSHFAGVVAAQNIHVFGDVLRYDMQDEAPPQYMAVQRIVDNYVARGIKDPFRILTHEPSLARDHGAPASEYAWAIIERHPAEFLAKSVPLGLSWLTSFYYESQVAPLGPFGGPLTWLQSSFRSLYGWNTFFPLFAVIWLMLLCWRRTRYLRTVQAMGAIVLLVLYGLVLTTLGGYYDYPRLHAPFNPLLILVVWATLLAGALLIIYQALSILARLVSHHYHHNTINTSIGSMLVAIRSKYLFSFGGRTIWESSNALISVSATPQLNRSSILSSSQLRRLIQATVAWPQQTARSVARALVEDWRTHKYALFAALLVVLTTVVVVAYYLNHPQIELNPDTGGYLDVVQHIQTQGQLVNVWRLPGYPLLIVLVYALTGQGNLLAVSVAHAVLFVLATLELYILAVLVLRQGWAAFLIGLLVGTNLALLSFIKPILSEALALWMLVSLTLPVALFVYTLRTRYLWLMTVFTLALFLTRPEWIYLPVPLFAYLLLVAARQGVVRRLLPHMLVSVILLYAVLGNYIYINAMANHFAEVVATENYNILGKVLQYDMQDEAPPQYVAVQRIVDTYVARGIKSPYYILDHEPSLTRNHYALANEYTQAIIERHPGEFLIKSVPLALSSLTDYYHESQVAPAGPFGTPLGWLQSVFRSLYGWNKFFPLCAVIWLLLLCWRRTAQLRNVQVMGAVVLLVLYGLIFTTLGVHQAYARVHIPFNPLLILVVWGSLLAGVLLVVPHRSHIIRMASQSFHRENRNIPTENLPVVSRRALSNSALKEPKNVLAETKLPIATSQTSHRSQYPMLSASQLYHLAHFIVTKVHRSAHSVGGALIEDWRTHKYALFATLLVLLTTILVVMYYLNHSLPEAQGDTASYLVAVQRIQAPIQLVDAHQLPGYSLLIILVYTFAGQGNLTAGSLANAVLFVLATLELYILAVLVLRRGWVALLISLLVGTNLTLLSFVKPLLSEALALWLLVSLALVVVLFVYRLRVRYLWLVTAFTLALFLTRAEWIYLPVPLFTFLLLVAARHGIARRLLPHILVSVILLYAFLGSYIYVNATRNHFVGVTDTQNINLWGKVVQYKMQDEAPHEYAAVQRIVDTYLAHGIKDPRYILGHEPSLTRNHYALAGAYAQAIIELHPWEFLIKSVPLARSSLTNYYSESQVAPAGPFGTPLVWMLSEFRSLYGWNKFFPPCAAMWVLLLCWRRTARLRVVQAMGAIVLLTLYGLIFTTLSGFQEYARYHTPFNPLLILVVWTTLLAGALLVVQQGPGVIAWLVKHSFHRYHISISTETMLVVSLGGVGLLLFTTRLLLTHGISSQIGVVFFLVITVVSLLRYFHPGEQK